MRGFQKRAEVVQLTDAIDQRVLALETEWIALHDAAGRVLTQEIVSACAVPGFDRAAMDGYALVGTETFGADNYAPLEFAVVGESLPARPFVGRVGTGQAVRSIHRDTALHDRCRTAPTRWAQAEIATEQAGKVRLNEAVPPGRHTLGGAARTSRSAT